MRERLLVFSWAGMARGYLDGRYGRPRLSAHHIGSKLREFSSELFAHRLAMFHVRFDEEVRYWQHSHHTAAVGRKRGNAQGEVQAA